MDGFSRDLNVEKEIAFWLIFSRRFRRICVENEWDEDDRRSLFKMMVVIMNAGPEHARKNCTFSSAVEKRKEEIINEFIQPEK